MSSLNSVLEMGTANLNYYVNGDEFQPFVNLLEPQLLYAREILI
ncbi:MAG TPA: hypothetical protein TECP_00402 [Hyphomicrobiaceae bacterium MAG_BT-2024]